jgi:hypothetical protein
MTDHSAADVDYPFAGIAFAANCLVCSRVRWLVDCGVEFAVRVQQTSLVTRKPRILESTHSTPRFWDSEPPQIRDRKHQKPTEGSSARMARGSPNAARHLRKSLRPTQRVGQTLFALISRTFLGKKNDPISEYERR